ncbi:YdaS family helix-turn-helix protein [Novacetimonas hansenii]|uniref:YdaS family helix-turn-helix protein n=1 Tax=Novacetimonas hansenii TaxID=436 RepID=UPI0009D75CE7|nr:YdaS family helix-turn-helix protein [Novacetimonas hansenii]
MKRVGGAAKVAHAADLRSHATVLGWKRIPDKHLIALEAATGIPREQLRPDLFRGVTVVRPEGEGVR